MGYNTFTVRYSEIAESTVHIQYEHYKSTKYRAWLTIVYSKSDLKTCDRNVCS